VPGFNPMSISAAHMRSAGATPVQSDGLMFAHAVAYCDALVARGLAFDDFAPRLSFLTSAYRDLFESAARFRACRRVWAELARDRFGAADMRSMQFRVHSGGDVDGMTIEEPLNNIARMTLNALAAALGGCQSMQLPCYDEAFEIPSEEAILNGLRVQQIVAMESGVCRTPDPLAGSYLVEHLTEAVAAEISAIVEDVDRQGGAVAWIEQGRTQEIILREAQAWEQRLADGREPRVGSNVARSDRPGAPPPHLHRHDPGVGKRQAQRVAAWRGSRSAKGVGTALRHLEAAATGSSNVMPALIHAVEQGATVGEMHEVFRSTFGTFRAPTGF
jgi:methylmalonyl-CoA mutase N-terminal domain/subunit